MLGECLVEFGKVVEKIKGYRVEDFTFIFDPGSGENRSADFGFVMVASDSGIDVGDGLGIQFYARLGGDPFFKLDVGRLGRFYVFTGGIGIDIDGFQNHQIVAWPNVFIAIGKFVGGG